MEWLDKILMRKFSGELAKTGKYWTLFGKRNVDGLAMFWDMTFMDFWMRGKPARRRRRIQMHYHLANDGGFIAFK